MSENISVSSIASVVEDLESLSKCTIPQLQQKCDERNLKRGGNKSVLITRLLAPQPGDSKLKRSVSDSTEASGTKKAKTSAVPKNKAGIEKLIGLWGYSDPEFLVKQSASNCVKAGMARGHIPVDMVAKLDGIAFSIDCEECREPIDVTLRELLAQPDYAGCDYEDGSANGAIQCHNEAADCHWAAYLTRICQGQLTTDSGKFHNHCRQCTSFGKCIGDYRSAHCEHCGKHYFMGMSGFPCSCQERGRGRGGFEDMFGNGGGSDNSNDDDDDGLGLFF